LSRRRSSWTTFSSNFEHEKEELHGKLRLLAAEVDSLKAECNSKQEKLLMLAKNQQEEEEVLIKKSEALEAAEVELDAIKLQLSDLKNAAVEKDILMVSLQQSIEDQNARLTDSEKLVGEKEAELEALRKSFEEKEVQLKKCTALIKKLKMQVKETNEAKEAELEQLRAQEEALRNKYDEVVAEKSDLDRTLTELQEKLSTSRDSYAIQNDSRADDSMEDVVEEKIEAQHAVQSLVASPAKVRSEVEQLQALADELVKSNSELKRANDGLVQYEQTVADLEQQIQALQKELDNRQADMESMHTGLVQYEQTVVDLEQQIQVLQQELENKQTDLESMQAHLKNEESQLERASHEAAEAAESMKKIETLQASVHELKMENDRLVAELTAARQISALSTPSSVESSPNAASTPSSKPSSHSELSAEKLAMKLDVAEAKNAKMLAKLRQFKEKNDELQKKIAELESKPSLDESNSSKSFVDVGSVTDNSIQEKCNASVCTEPADENNESMLVQQNLLADVESKLSESESHCKELELKAAFLANELDNANQQIVALQTELALSSEVEQSHLADLQNKLLESDDLNSELASKAASLSSELDDVKKHVAALQAELAACNEKSTNLQHDRLADLEIEIKKCEDQRTELELKAAELDESKNMISALQAELAAHSSTSAHLQELVLENKSQAETIAELSEALQQSEEALKVGVKASKEKEKEHYDSWGWSDDDNDNNSVQHLKTALDEKDKQLNALNAKLSDFEEQWQNDCEKHQDTLNKLQLAEERLADNEQELAKYLATIKELEMRLKQMRGSSPQMNRGSPSPQLAQFDAGNLATENRMLHHQLEELREKYATLEAEYEGTTEEMQLEVARLQQTVQQYEQRQHMLPVREISPIHEEVRRQVQPLQTSAPDKSSPLKSSPNTVVASTLTELSGEQLDKLFVENAALKELNQSASDQLKLKSKAAEDARKEVESRRKDVERLEAELTRCRQEAEEERKSFDRQQGLVAKEAQAFHSRCTSLEEQLSEVDNLQDQIVETSALNAHLQRKLDALQADKQEIEDQLTVAQKKVQQLKQDLEDSTDYNEQMQAQLVELSSEKSILIRQLEGLKLEASELKTVQQAHELSLKKHDELKAECKSLQHKLSAAQSRLQELEHCEAECVSLNAEVTRVLGDNTALVLKVGELYEQVKALEATVEQQRVDNHKQLAAELDAAKSEQEQLKLDKQRLGETLKEAIDSATALSDELKELRAEKLRLDSVNRELDAKLVEATNAAAQSVDELALLTDELQTVTSDRAQQEQIIAELKAEQMALLATVAEQNAQLAELKEENTRNEHKWEMAVRDVKLMHVETNRLRMLEEEHERDKRFIAEKLQLESGEHLADKETLAVELEEATRALQLRDDKLRLANNKVCDIDVYGLRLGIARHS
jgi:chromosome segregation ATPase